MKSIVAGMVLVVCLAGGAFAADPNVPPAAPGLPAPNANDENRYQGRVESLDKTKIVVVQLRQGDSLDRPSGKREELAITDKTKFLNIRAQEIGDDAMKLKVFSKGQVVIVTVEEKDRKRIAASLQLVGG